MGIGIVSKSCVRVDNKIKCGEEYRKFNEAVLEAITSNPKTFNRNYFELKKTIQNALDKISREYYKYYDRDTKPFKINFDSYLKYTREAMGYTWRTLNRATALSRLKRLEVPLVVGEKTPLIPREEWEGIRAKTKFL